MAYQLPRVPYAYDALEPHIDEATMKVHHQGHHQAYTDKLNAGLATLKELACVPRAHVRARGIERTSTAGARSDGIERASQMRAATTLRACYPYAARRSV